MIRVAWHLGLGDAIVCVPIIAKLASSGEEIILPCWEHNLVSVQSFFVDYDNIKIQPVRHDEEFNKYEFKLGYYGDEERKLGESFVDWFYRQAKMNVVDRISYCPLIKASLKIEQRKVYSNDFAIIHDDDRRGFVIDRNKIGNKMPAYIDDNGKSILQYVESIKEANEIHCIDSSFLHLVEAVPSKGKLFYHKYSRPHSEAYKFLKSWGVYEID